MEDQKSILSIEKRKQMNYKFKNLHLINFGKFTDINILFDKRITLLKGGCSLGHTIICKALRILLCPLIYNYGYMNKFVGINNYDFRIDLDGLLPSLETKIESNFVFNKVDYLLEKSKNLDNMKVKNSKTYKTIQQEIEKQNKQLIDHIKDLKNPRPLFPIIASYGEEYKDFIKDKDKYYKDMLIPQKAYYECLEDPTHFTMFREWFYATYSEYISTKLHNDIKDVYFTKSTLDVMNSLVKKIYKKYNIDALELKWNYNGGYISRSENKDTISIITKKGEIDDIPTVVFIILDIAHKIIRLNGFNDISIKDSLKKTEGVVIIDGLEKRISLIDLNKMIYLLKDLFPNVQFIISYPDTYSSNSIEEEKTISVVDL